jgi:transposase InsO family protein
MHELVREYPRYGYRFIWAKLRQRGWHVNVKKIFRLWRREGFKVPRKTRKKRRLGHSGNSCVRRRAEHPDHVWTWDFIHDRTTTGQPLKWFAITDEYTRECLALEVDRGITADRVLDVLVSLFLTRGVPRHIRSDNGPEFIATAIRRHGEQAGLEMLYIEPGSPWENGFAESFFSRLRDELLNCEEFANLAEARWFARRRQEEHNHERPHSSLGYRPPSARDGQPATLAVRLRYGRVGTEDYSPALLTEPDVRFTHPALWLENSSDSWADACGGWRSVQRALSEAIRRLKHHGG